jgi:Pretoxin HINT domain
LRILDQAQYEQAARQTLQQDIQNIEVMNAGIRELNDRVLPLARASTGQDFGSDSEAWMKWWTNELGYAYQSPETTTKPTYTDVIDFQYQRPVHSSCFSAGTAVHTISGPQAVETIQVGDRVLSQNTTTGALTFQPVVAIHHNQPTATLKLYLGGETIVATGIHRFWKAGKGWTMARDLKPGDIVRTVGGTARVESVGSDKVQPVYNLDVAENRDFFVGKHGCLVYDFSIVQPVVAPFDHAPDLAALEPKAKLRGE